MKRWPNLTMLAAGALSGLAMPSFSFWWLLFLTLPLVLLRLESLTQNQWRAAALSGLCFGFGYFVVALHWIGYAFLVDAQTYLWMMPFAVGGLALFLSCYWAAAFALSSLIPRSWLPAYLSLPLCLSVAEWLRGHLLTGFPWAAPGLAADAMGGTLQLASLIGMPGLTLCLLLWSLLPVEIFQRRRQGWKVVMLPALLLATLPLAVLWGNMRVNSLPTAYQENVKLRLVQPNISQNDKWRADNGPAIFDQLLNLSAEDGADIDIVVWPESSVPFLLDEAPEALAQIGAMLGPDRQLLAGAIRRQNAETASEAYFTSILLVDGMGVVRDSYDKWRLVPGGEFLPFEPLLARLGFRKVVSLPESFTAGEGPRNLNTRAAGPAGALICYEAIFPHDLVSRERPQWLVNVTNDGWFGLSTGPYQHLAQMRLRSVEQGLPAVRGANTGISAVIDPVGRIVASTRLGDTVKLDSALPLPLPATLYARMGDFMLLVLIGAIALFTVICRVLGLNPHGTVPEV